MPAADDWSHAGICVLFGLMSGIGNDLFDPAGGTTRAMLVSMLYRMAGEPDVSELPELEDVAPDAWYADAVRWAYANEVSVGVDDTHFAPDARLTRAQQITMLYRVFGPEKGVRPRPIGGYEDWNTVPEWAFSPRRGRLRRPRSPPYGDRSAGSSIWSELGRTCAPQPRRKALTPTA